MVDGKPAAVVLVKAKGLNDTRVYFDKQTGYMVKTLRKGLNLEGKEVEEATVNSNFEKVMGVVVPKKAVVTHDGKPFMTAEVTEYKLAEKLDPKLFTTAD